MALEDLAVQAGRVVRLAAGVAASLARLHATMSGRRTAHAWRHAARGLAHFHGRTTRPCAYRRRKLRLAVPRRSTLDRRCAVVSPSRARTRFKALTATRSSTSPEGLVFQPALRATMRARRAALRSSGNSMRAALRATEQDVRFGWHLRARRHRGAPRTTSLAGASLGCGRGRTPVVVRAVGRPHGVLEPCRLESRDRRVHRRVRFGAEPIPPQARGPYDQQAHGERRPGAARSCRPA